MNEEIEVTVTKVGAPAPAKTRRRKRATKTAMPTAEPSTQIEVDGVAHVKDIMSKPALLEKHVEAVAYGSYPPAAKLVEDHGGNLVAILGHWYIEGIAAPCCGAKVVTAMDTPALGFRPGHIHMSRPSETRPAAIWCVACPSPWTGHLGTFLRDVCYPGDLEALKKYLQSSCRSVQPMRSRYVRASFNGQMAVREHAEDAIREVMPVEFAHGTEVELTLISAYNEDRALSIAIEHSLPTAAVPVTTQCEPTILGWHGTQTTAAERSTHEQYLRRQQRELRRQLDVELFDYRYRREMELGLR